MSDQEKPRSRIRQGGASVLNPNEFFNDFRRLNTIYAFMDRLVESYPRLISSQSIGQTFEGRDMKMLRITSPSKAGQTKPIFWIDAGIHAREWVSASLPLLSPARVP